MVYWWCFMLPEEWTSARVCEHSRYIRCEVGRFSVHLLSGTMSLELNNLHNFIQQFGYDRGSAAEEAIIHVYKTGVTYLQTVVVLLYKGFHLSSWIGTDLIINCSWEHLHKKQYSWKSCNIYKKKKVFVAYSCSCVCV